MAKHSAELAQAVVEAGALDPLVGYQEVGSGAQELVCSPLPSNFFLSLTCYVPLRFSLRMFAILVSRIETGLSFS